MARRPIVEKPKRRITFKGVIWSLTRSLFRIVLAVFLLVLLVVLFYRVFNPPATYYMFTEFLRIGHIRYDWVDLEDMSPAIPLSVVAAEDANFCAHNGFDFDAIEQALEEGSQRGASTISQQVAKNVFLWPDRSWVRKGMEAGLTVLIEALWPKHRILEVYLNVAETGDGIFGVRNASFEYYNKPPDQMTRTEAAKLAVILPNPKDRNPATLQGSLWQHSNRVAAGGDDLRISGRADCFLDFMTP